MLAERPAASAVDSETSEGDGAAGPDSGSPRTGSFGARSARKRRRLLRRSGVALPAAGLALLLVVVVWGAAKVMDPRGTGAASLYQTIDGLGQSGSVALLEAEQQTLITMTNASRALATTGKPAVADAQEILQQQEDSGSGSGTGETGGGTGVTVTPPPSNPTAAESTAQSLLASFGFSSAQWPCLYDLWQRESGWNVYAENTASGAYGIPQSLPGDKMASAGADWQTDAATQIRWGLGYIQGVYGTPCAAWSNEESYGYY